MLAALDVLSKHMLFQMVDAVGAGDAVAALRANPPAIARPATPIKTTGTDG